MFTSCYDTKSIYYKQTNIKILFFYSLLDVYSYFQGCADSAVLDFLILHITKQSTKKLKTA